MTTIAPKIDFVLDLARQYVVNNRRKPADIEAPQKGFNYPISPRTQPKTSLENSTEDPPGNPQSDFLDLIRRVRALVFIESSRSFQQQTILTTTQPDSVSSISRPSSHTEPLAETLRSAENDAYELINDQLAEIPQPVPGTCSWIIDDQKYTRWCSQSSSERLLLIRGAPGLGKTVLVKAIYADLTRNHFTAVPFFCKSGKDKRNSIIGVLATWLYCVLLDLQTEFGKLGDSKQPEADSVQFKQFFSTLERGRDKTSKSHIDRDNFLTSAELWQCLDICASISFMKHKRYVFLLDALDECTYQSQVDWQEIVTAFNHNLSFHVLVTSRSEPELLPSLTSEIALEISMDSEKLFDSVLTFFEYVCNERQLGDIVTTETTQKLRERARNNADGLFLFVACWLEEVLRTVNQLKGSLTNADGLGLLKVEMGSEKITSYFAEKLEILVESRNAKQGIAILNIFLAAQEPLSLQEFRAAYLFSHNSYESYSRFLEDDAWPRFDEVMQLCGSLLRFQGPSYDDPKSTVSIVHETARKVLTGPELQRSWRNPSPNVESSMISTIEGHVLLAKACLNYLTCIHHDKERFSSYALGYWHLHVRGSEARVSSILRLIADFYNEKVMGFAEWSRLTAINTSYQTGKRQDTRAFPATSLVQLDLLNILEHMHSTCDIGIATLDHHRIDLDKIDDKGDSPLTLSMHTGKTDIACRLLELGASVCDLDVGPLHLAAFLGHDPVIRKCHELGYDLNVNLDATGFREAVEPPSFSAIYGRNLETFKLLCQLGANKFVSPKDGGTILHEACRMSALELVTYIIEEKLVDINSKDDAKMTPLIIASTSEHENAVQCVRILLQHSADPNLCDEDGRSALWWAAAAKQRKTFPELFPITSERNKPTCEEGDWAGWTVLHICARNGWTPELKELVSEDGDIDIPTQDGSTALIIALECNHEDTALLLMQSGANAHAVSQEGHGTLYKACQNGLVEAVKALIAENVMCVATLDKISCLQIAAWDNHAVVLECLLLANSLRDKIDVRWQGEGFTPLNCALTRGNYTAAKLLLAAGANVNLCSSDWLALHYICRCKDQDDLFDIILKRTDLDLLSATTRHGDTPLHFAAETGSVHCVSSLIARGARCCVVNDHGRSPLMNACLSGDADKIGLLLQCPDKFLNRRDKSGWTALRLAAIKCEDVMVLNKLTTRSTWSYSKRSAATPLSTAAFNGNFNAVKVFLEHRMPADLITERGESALYLFSERWCDKITTLLLRHGANVNRTSSHNVPPLLLGVYSYPKEVLPALLPTDTSCLSRKANTTLTNGANELARCEVNKVKDILRSGLRVACRSLAGHTPLSNAIERRNSEMVQYLLTLPGIMDLVNKPSEISFRTSLIEASRQRDSKSVRILLEQGHADVYHRDFLGFTAFDYSFMHSPTREELLSAGFAPSDDWVESASQLSMPLRIYLLLSWYSQVKNVEEIARSNLDLLVYIILAEMLFIYGDAENGLTAREMAYGRPSTVADNDFVCTICVQVKWSSGWICKDCPWVFICPECRADEDLMQPFGCLTHTHVEVPGKDWYTLDPDHVVSGKTAETWLEDLMNSYRERTAPTSDVFNLVGTSKRFIPFEYGKRQDVFKLLEFGHRSVLQDHLQNCPRDIWLRDHLGNNLVMQCIRWSTDDKYCEEWLQFLAAEGAYCLTRNAEGQSSIDLACLKGFELTAKFLLSTYDTAFSSTENLEKGGRRSEETMKHMISHSWRDALLYAVERHFPWASYGEYHFLEDLDLLKCSDVEMVDFLLANQNFRPDSEDTLSESSEGSEALLEPVFQKIGNTFDTNLHAPGCAHSMINRELVLRGFYTGSDEQVSNVREGSDEFAQEVVKSISGVSRENDVWNYTNDDLQSLVTKVFVLCGMEDIFTPRDAFLSSEAQASHTDAFLRYIKTASINLKQAIHEIQQARLCCGTFSVLVDDGEITPNEQPIVAMRNVDLVAVREFLHAIDTLLSTIHDAEGTDLEEPKGTDGLLDAAHKVLDMVFERESKWEAVFDGPLDTTAKVLQFLSIGICSFVTGHAAGSKLLTRRARKQTPIFLCGDAWVTSPVVPSSNMAHLGAKASLVVRPRVMACVGDMLGGELLVFSTIKIFDKQRDRSTKPCLVLATAVDIMEVWGPALIISRDTGDDRPSNTEVDILAIELQDGYITLDQNTIDLPNTLTKQKCAHWASRETNKVSQWGIFTEGQAFVDGKELLSNPKSVPTDALTFKPSENLLIGGLSKRKCQITSEATYEHCSSEMVELDTVGPYWQLTGRGLTANLNAPHLGLTATRTTTRIQTVTVKQAIQAHWIKRQEYYQEHERNITPWDADCYKYLNAPSGVIFSICTTLSGRVPLREAISRVWKAWAPSLSDPERYSEAEWDEFNDQIKRALSGMSTELSEDPEKQLSILMSSLTLWEQNYVHHTVGRNLSRMHFTGLSGDQKTFKIAWFERERGAMAFEFDVKYKGSPRWLHALRDTEKIATFALATIDCLADTTMCRKSCKNAHRGHSIVTRMSLLDTRIYRRADEGRDRQGNVIDDGSLVLEDDWCYFIKSGSGPDKRRIPAVLKTMNEDIDLIVLPVAWAKTALFREKLGQRPAMKVRELNSPAPRNIDRHIMPVVRITPHKDWREQNGIFLDEPRFSARRE